MLDLNKFCGAAGNDEKLKIDSPWSEGAYTYATNGHLFIRVPRVADVPERVNAPAAKDLEVLIFGCKGEFIQVPVVEFLDRIVCGECLGRGMIACSKCGNWLECLACDNDGTVPSSKSYPVGGALFDQRYIALLGELPNCLIYPQVGFAASPFIFDGGDGVIMPRHSRNEN